VHHNATLLRCGRVIKEEKGRSVPIGCYTENGYVTVWLKGKKLRGGDALIHLGGGDKKRWFLLKMGDKEADARRNPVGPEREFVLSGRGFEGITEKTNSII
jgi:hypothetical protein